MSTHEKQSEKQPASVIRVAVVEERHKIVLFDQYGNPLLEESKKPFAQPVKISGTVRTKEVGSKGEQTVQRAETNERVTNKQEPSSDAEKLTQIKTIRPETAERDGEATQEPDIKPSPLTPYGTRAEERIRKVCNESEEKVVSEVKPQGQSEEEFDKWYQEELKKEGVEKFAKQVEAIRQKKEAEEKAKVVITDEEASKGIQTGFENGREGKSPRGGEENMASQETQPKKREYKITMKQKVAGVILAVAAVGAGIGVGVAKATEKHSYPVDSSRTITLDLGQSAYVPAGSIVSGDVIVDGQRLFDDSRSTGLIVEMEKSAKVTAPFGATIKEGFKDAGLMDSVAEQLREETLRVRPEITEVDIVTFPGAKPQGK